MGRGNRSCVQYFPDTRGDGMARRDFTDNKLQETLISLVGGRFIAPAAV